MREKKNINEPKDETGYLVRAFAASYCQIEIIATQYSAETRFGCMRPNCGDVHLKAMFKKIQTYRNKVLRPLLEGA